MERELVSIIMPTYNRAGIIKNAIDSVIKQYYSDWELIIVDDYGNDDTERIIHENYSVYKNIVYLRNHGVKGVASARNYGIKHSRGKLIAFLDSDDEWLPEHLSVALDVLNKSKHKVFFANWITESNQERLVYVEKSKNVYNTVLDASYKNLDNRFYCFDRQFIEYMTLQKAYFYHINTMVIRKVVIEEVGDFDVELRASEDMDFSAKCIERYGFIYDIHPHFIYHQGIDNIYNFCDRSHIDLVALLNDRKQIEKMVFCDTYKCRMLIHRKKLIKNSNVVKCKIRCYQACNERLASKYYTMAILIQEINRKLACRYVIYSIKYKFRLKKIKTLFYLVFFPYERVLINEKELNFR